jgi:hypothetical protein
MHINIDISMIDPNPNCSEVVFELPGMTVERAREELAKIGIIEVAIPKNEYDGSKTTDPTMIIADRDNPDIPDFACNADFRLRKERNGDAYIIGGQSGQHQLFPTMLKIENAFHRDWHGYDGGGTEEYDDWKDEVKMKKMAIEMRSRGKTDEQIAAYLAKKYPY